MILRHTKTRKCFHVCWTGIREWATAICYEDLTKTKVRRTGKITFQDKNGEEYLRTTAKAIQETEAA